jgi:hypothetical protein
MSVQKIIQMVKMAAASICMFSIIGISGCTEDNKYDGHWETKTTGARVCRIGGDECKATDGIQCTSRDLVGRIFSFK